jgi:hypothetical protein
MQESKVALERKEYYKAIDQLADKLEIQSKSVSFFFIHKERSVLARCC